MILCMFLGQCPEADLCNPDAFHVETHFNARTEDQIWNAQATIFTLKY